MKLARQVTATVVSALALMACGGQTASQTSHQAPDPAIKQYQTMLTADEQNALSAQSNNCVTLRDGCPAAVAVLNAALQKWLDDLNRAQPPARFAYVDAQLRRHVAVAIFDLNTAVAAYKAGSQDGMVNAIIAAVDERDDIETEVADIVTSTQGTPATYATAVKADRSSLVACLLCQQLMNEDLVSSTEIDGTRSTVEAFQGDLVRILAPDSLVAMDGRLQADLFAADASLGAMQSALSAGDLIALQAGHNALHLALSRVDSDAADILNSR